jgi:hypothetical protein
MKRIYFLLLMLAVFPFAADAQAAYQPGNNVIAVAVGLGGSFGGYAHTSSTPAINLQYERGIWQAGPGVISLGAYAGIKSYKYSYNYYGGYTYSEKWNYTILGLRGAYHLQELKGTEFQKLDLYAGLMLSYNILKYSYTDNDPYSNYNVNQDYGSNASLTEFVGARYFFNPHFGAMAEVGYGISYLNVGLAYKF